MVEFIRHALGLCGEHWHPNLLNISLMGFGVGQGFFYIKYLVEDSKKKLWKRRENS